MRSGSVAERVIVEPEKVLSSQGSHVVRGAATLIFRCVASEMPCKPFALFAYDFRVGRWDNTHSRFTSKTIRFHCHTVPLEEEEHEAIAAVEEAAHMKLPSLGHSVVAASQSDQQVIVFAFVPFSGVLIEPA